MRAALVRPDYVVLVLAAILSLAWGLVVSL